MDDLQYLREKGESMRAAMGDATFADALLRLVGRVEGLEHSLSDAMEQIEAIQGSNAVRMARVKELETPLTPKPMSEAPRDGSWFWIIESAYWMADKGQWLTVHDPSAGWIPGPGPRGDEQLTAPRD